MFSAIKLSDFDNPEVDENTIRECVISPIINRLGYQVSGATRVTRGKRLINDFIHVGTTRHPVTTIPDYSFYVNEKIKFIMDAKSPRENILDGKHIQQAYSYAIHPEVGCDEFGLCNGRELVIFGRFQSVPKLHLTFDEFESKWSEIEKYLSPRFLATPAVRSFVPDFGTAVKRMGHVEGQKIYVFNARPEMFYRLNNHTISATSNSDCGFGTHMTSFDFNSQMIVKVIDAFPLRLMEVFYQGISNAPFQVNAGHLLDLDLLCVLGKETDVEHESFIPLIVQDVIGARINTSEVGKESNIPAHVSKLRDFLSKECY